MRKSEVIKFLLPAVIWAAMPLSVSATVEISEIMYDPEGNDANAGGEWIEVYNTDSQAIDLTQWKFFESETNHGISTDNVSEIPANGYAIISSNLDYFKSFFNNYSGPLFKASFSLNDGEMLAMKSSKEATPSDSVTYSSDWGGKGDGNSLQKINGQWKVGLATPGVANVVNSSGNNLPANTPNSSQSQNTSQTTTTVEEQPKMSVDAGANRTVIVGADALLSGKALGADGKPLDNVRYLWNFGDGETKEGQNVLHRFRFPGEYIITLDVAYGKWSSSARLTATAIKSPLVISRVEKGKTGFVELANEGDAVLDLFGWYLKSNNVSFLIPKNTVIVGGKKIIFPNEVTKIETSDVILLYPNGMMATGYEEPVAPAPVSVPTKASLPAKPDDFPRSDLVEHQVRPGKETDTDIPTTTGSVATVYEATSENSGGLGVWFLALGGLIVVSLGALIFTKKQSISSRLVGGQAASDYEIIE
ncbi:MAG TPA: lamin tail domain-containing protein [Candidatus Paceibacterota bacterium]